MNPRRRRIRRKERKARKIVALLRARGLGAEVHAHEAIAYDLSEIFGRPVVLDVRRVRRLDRRRFALVPWR